MAHPFGQLVKDPRRPLGVGVCAALVAGSLALSFGTGYVANKAVFSGSSAWLRQGDDAALVSGAGGAAQDQVRDVPEGTIVQNDDGTFHTVGPTDGGEGRTFRSGGGAGPGGTIEAGEHAELLSGPGGAWLVDPDIGRVQPVRLADLSPVGEPIEVGQPLVGQALDVDGTHWVLDDDARVRRLDGRRFDAARPIEVGDPQQVHLVTVGQMALVVDPVRGRISEAGGGGRWQVDGLEGGRVEVASRQPGPVLAWRC
jgi:hypothetical protein